MALGDLPTEANGRSALGDLPTEANGRSALGDLPTEANGRSALGDLPTEANGRSALGDLPTEANGRSALGDLPTEANGRSALGDLPTEANGRSALGDLPTEANGRSGGLGEVGLAAASAAGCALLCLAAEHGQQLELVRQLVRHREGCNGGSLHGGQMACNQWDGCELALRVDEGGEADAMDGECMRVHV